MAQINFTDLSPEQLRMYTLCVEQLEYIYMRGKSEISRIIRSKNITPKHKGYYENLDLYPILLTYLKNEIKEIEKAEDSMKRFYNNNNQ